MAFSCTSSTPPTTQLGQLCLEAPAPPQPHPLFTQEDIYNQQLGSITIGSCGAYLVSAIYSLPPDKRAHALTSLKAWGSYVRPKEPRIATARILHTLQNLVGAVLSPTHCPLHHDAPAFALLRALPFPGRALVEHYTGGAMLTCPTQGVGLLRRLHRCTSLRELEKVLLLSIGRDGEDAAMADHYIDGMRAVDWVVNLVADGKSEGGYRVEHVGPQGLQTSTFFHRTLGADRFLRVQVQRGKWCSDAGKAAIQHLATHGLSFACRRYRYIGHKDPSRGECYMVAEESLGREGPHFQPLTSDRAIGLLGDFNHFPSLSKMAARVALGFSRSWTLELASAQVEVVEDECSPSGAIMTEGSGFIAPDLLSRVPARLYQGRESCRSELDTEGSQSQSKLHPVAVIQVRLFCAHGGFKGTLLVNPRLRGVIQLRRTSMKKFPPPSKPPQDKTGRATAPCLEVLTCFRPLKASTRLSRELMLLLMAIGVPASTFRRLLHDELRSLEAAAYDRAALLDVLKDSSQACVPLSGEWQVLRMLSHHHSPTEPYVHKVFSGLRSRVLKKLRQGRVRCRHSLYLVGQPDPLGVLKPGEVMVCHGLDPMHHQLGEAPPVHSGFYEGPVLLARHPIHDPDCLVRFQAVCPPELKAYMGAHRGVVLFSTRGDVSPVTRLSGGDYDGDVFWVCANPDILRPLEAKASQAAPDLQARGATDLDSQTGVPPPTLRCSLPSSEASVVTSVGPLDLGSGPVGPLVNQDTMARALECFFAQSKIADVISRGCEWWLTHADRQGAGCSACRQLGGVIAAALDSAKTGRLIALPPHLKPQEVPAYISRFGKPRLPLCDTSTPSLLAHCYQEVTVFEQKLTAPWKRDGALTLDPDLRVKGSAGFLQQADAWVKDYRDQFNKRMAAINRPGVADRAAFSYQVMRGELATSFRQRFESLLQCGGASTIQSQRRLALASALYEANYLHGTLLHMVWDVAMPELNQLKRDRQRKEVH